MARRRSRAPEINALLAGWASIDTVSWVDRLRLDQHGLSSELERDGVRFGLSAHAKALLLLDELEYRRLEAFPDSLDKSLEPAVARKRRDRAMKYREDVILHRILLEAGLRAGAAALAAGPQQWANWKDAHREIYRKIRLTLDRSISSTKVVKVRRTRYVLGETQNNHQRYERLRDELGPRFIKGTADREAKVRKWEQRRRDRVQVLGGA
jgi:hypothetical protein